jgi:uncharacterized protein (TIGR03118 family)
MKKLLLSLILGLLASFAQAQQTGYKQTNLVANTAGIAHNTDTQLSNPWGIAFLPGQPFWIANNNGGTSTLYDASGNKNSLVVQIPSASVNPCNPGCPTGIVANSSGADFGGALFLFDTEDGILVGWSQGTSGTTVVDNSAAGAVYKGLALLNNGSGNFLLAANFRSGKIDVFDRTFKPTALAGTFTDPNLPAGFAPHGVHIVNNQVFVAYALQDGPKHDPVNGTGNGVVDIFDGNGNFVKRFASAGTLNSPWGVTAAPSNFGQFSNAILVGNFGDGTINAFNPTTGNLLGQIDGTNGSPIVNLGLWDLTFGNGAGAGSKSILYFTAGIPQYGGIQRAAGQHLHPRAGHAYAARQWIRQLTRIRLAQKGTLSLNHPAIRVLADCQARALHGWPTTRELWHDGCTLWPFPPCRWFLPESTGGQYVDQTG